MGQLAFTLPNAAGLHTVGPQYPKSLCDCRPAHTHLHSCTYTRPPGMAEPTLPLRQLPPGVAGSQTSLVLQFHGSKLETELQKQK